MSPPPPRSAFHRLLHAPAEALREKLVPLAADFPAAARPGRLAAGLGLSHAQLVCALGFSLHGRQLHSLPGLLGLAGRRELELQRDRAFIHDVYRELPFDELMALYRAVREDAGALHVMQYLMRVRLEHIEQRIEGTVDSLTITRYKKEVRTLYMEGIAGLDFAAYRLSRTENGFRALVNEVEAIAESRLIPVGELFFMDDVLIEEKRRLIQRGHVPRELVAQRLRATGVPTSERRMLLGQLKRA